MVDCSHANASKDHNVQPLVTRDIGNQIVKGNKSIVGLMLESHLHAGRQDIPADLTDLQYGVSVTDACMDWNTTEDSLRELANGLRSTLRSRQES
jgi:3-deoxy-7-phosphoheptulonate synthase